jgi:hypothetical protein
VRYESAVGPRADDAVTIAGPRLRSIGAKVYYLALFLCPPAFRREFSAEMARDVDEAIAETWREGRRLERVALWCRIGTDLARTVFTQWLRTGLPILIPCSALAMTIALGLTARILGHGRLTVPVAPADRDLMTLIVLTGVVLIVVLATILFTFWFSRPLLRRQRR